MEPKVFLGKNILELEYSYIDLDYDLGTQQIPHTKQISKIFAWTPEIV